MKKLLTVLLLAFTFSLFLSVPSAEAGTVKIHKHLKRHVKHHVHHRHHQKAKRAK